MKCVRVWTLVAGVLLTTAPAVGADERQELAAALTDLFAEVDREGTLPEVPVERLVADPQEALSLLDPYCKNASPAVRCHANGLVWQVGTASADRQIRQAATERLVSALEDPHELVWQQAAGELESFESVDFSRPARETLGRLLREEPPRRDVVRVVGVAAVLVERPRLRELLIDESQYERGEHVGRWYGTVSWAARLALARMGDQEALRRVIELVEAEKDDIIRVTLLSRDLGYTRQPAALEVLGKHLESNKRLSPVRERGPGTLYAQYALDVIAENFADCPVDQKYPGAYTSTETTQALVWLRSRGRQ